MTAHRRFSLYRPPLVRALGGARTGFVAACGMILFGVVTVLLGALVSWLRGGVVASGFAMEDLPWLGLYVTGGAASGAVAGLLLPLARTRPGAVLAGIAALQPMLYFIVRIVDHVEPGPQDAAAAAGAWILVSLLLGPIIGLRWIRSYHDGPELP
ncbi:MAG: hypothetical protein ABW277_00410 [Longimicrobiaceae bacterium]